MNTSVDGMITMNKEQIVSRMNELGVIARQRMEASAHYPDKVYAEIMHMTQEECSEMLELRLMLPNSGEEREAAKGRIKEKINQRKRLRNGVV